jgi:multicomponent Na+:H+ antiporter subunit B
MTHFKFKWLYLFAGLALFVKALLIPNPAPELTESTITQLIIADSGVANAVSAIILRNRLYDTIFEVVVFTIAILGCSYLLANEKTADNVRQFTDQPSIVLAKLGATITALVGVELALRGHLSPGGGFAAGVALGTAIGLWAITSSPTAMQAVYQRWHAAIWEKVSVLVFIVLSIITLAGYELPHGTLGDLFSGGIVPILNVIVAIKVALGSWAAVLIFMRYRGLL